MKIAITAKTDGLDAPVDPRFGRAPFLTIVDPDSLDFESIDNAANVNAFKGAGIQAATLLSDQGVATLLTGFCGPNAFKMLEAADIKVATNVTGTVREAVALFKAGQLTYAASANADGHW